MSRNAVAQWIFLAISISIAESIDTGRKGLSVFDSPEYLIHSFVVELKELKSFLDYRRNIKSQVLPFLYYLKHLYTNKSSPRKYEYDVPTCRTIFAVQRSISIFKAAEYEIALWTKSIDSLLKLQEHRGQNGISTFHTIDSPKSVINGAILGIVLLQNVYQLDISTFMNNKMDNETVENISRRRNYEFDAMDLICFATKAIELKWYISANKYLNYINFWNCKKISCTLFSNQTEVDEWFFRIKDYTESRLLNSDEKSLDVSNLKYLPFNRKAG